MVASDHAVVIGGSVAGLLAAAEIEQVEADSYADFEDAASPAAKAALGTRRLRIGGGVALALPNDPSGFWSKAVGLGFTRPPGRCAAPSPIFRSARRPCRGWAGSSPALVGGSWQPTKS